METVLNVLLVLITLYIFVRLALSYFFPKDT